MSIHNIDFYGEIRKCIPEYSPLNNFYDLVSFDLQQGFGGRVHLIYDLGLLITRPEK